MTETPDPNKVKVFMNVGFTWAFMQHLDHISEQRKESKAQLVRKALEAAYPMDPKELNRRAEAARSETREAGATK